MSATDIRKILTLRIIGMLQSRLDSVRYRIMDNKRTMHNLVNEQTLLKRERYFLTQIMSDLRRNGIKEAAKK